MVAPKKNKPDEAEEVFNENLRTDDNFIFIETANTTYQLKRPRGIPVGRDHFRLTRKYFIKPKFEDDKQLDPTPAETERSDKAFDEWIDVVLPAILVSHKVDDVYAEDFMAIFGGVSAAARMKEELFRIV